MGDSLRFKGRFLLGLMWLGLMHPMMLFAQFSPGDLSEAHAHLEGLSNCTECHDIGSKISEAKCLACHEEIQSLIALDRGYHASAEVDEKQCIDCHSEHHGRKFDAVRFNEDAFDHNLTGYKLEGAHDRIDCRDCHQPEHINNRDLAGREGTFLGMETACLDCHDDYHQTTLDSKCTACHGMETFEDPPHFDHAKTKFPLRGAHKEVECVDCHPMTQKAGMEFQEFSLLAFSKCTDCHEDAHSGKFGARCTDCHSEVSWHKLKANNAFNHDLTAYPLEGMHAQVACAECHTSGAYADELAFAACTDCHADYHKDQFAERYGSPPDCASCHDLQHPFTFSWYGMEEHAQSEFPLEGAHMATPCFACHKPEGTETWNFELGSDNCTACHESPHEGVFSPEFATDDQCISCHVTDAWTLIHFDHATTDWPLEGGHSGVDCKACHTSGASLEEVSGDWLKHQQFRGTAKECAACHADVHGGQFAEQGVTECKSCHSTNADWQPDVFNHDSTAFPLEGRHREVACADCHTQKAWMEPDSVEYVRYQIENYACVTCHGQ